MVQIWLMRSCLETGFNFCLSDFFFPLAKSLEQVWPFSFWDCTVDSGHFFRLRWKIRKVLFHYFLLYNDKKNNSTNWAHLSSGNICNITLPWFWHLFFQPYMLNLYINYLKCMATCKDIRWLSWLRCFNGIYCYMYTFCLKVKKIPKFYIWCTYVMKFN